MRESHRDHRVHDRDHRHVRRAEPAQYLSTQQHLLAILVAEAVAAAVAPQSCFQIVRVVSATTNRCCCC
jgi:hypothetical protein